MYKFSGDTYNDNGSNGTFTAIIPAIVDELLTINEDVMEQSESTERIIK